MSIVTLRNLLFEFIIKQAILQSQLCVSLDGRLYLVLVKLRQWIESHNFIFEVVFGERKLGANFSQFTGIAKNQFILILCAILEFLAHSLWVNKMYYICWCLTNRFGCTPIMLAFNSCVNYCFRVVALAQFDSRLNSSIFLCMNSRIGFDSGIFPINKVSSIDVNLLSNYRLKLVFKDST